MVKKTILTSLIESRWLVTHVAANIEFKARLNSPAEQEATVLDLVGTPPEILFQRDTFFNAAHGRLKLREISGAESQLIQYFRDDDPSARRSDYVIAPVSDSMMMIEALDRAHGIRGIVRKVRKLWLVGQTRIHFDSVDELGEFAELEVVLEPNQSDEEGLAIAHDLMQKLSIFKEDIVECAYIDLLETASPTQS